MNSKEALKRIYNDALSLNEIEEDVEEIKKDYDLIKQDLDRLEQLEKENKELKFVNENLNKYTDNLRQNQNIQNLYLNQEIYKLKKALDILKDKIEFEDLGEMQSGNVYRGYFNDCFDEEEYELLKEVLGSE